MEVEKVCLETWDKTDTSDVGTRFPKEWKLEINKDFSSSLGRRTSFFE